MAEGYKIEFDNINQRITTIADVFNASIGEMRTDFRALDTRIHALLEEGVISSLGDRVTAIEQCVHSIPKAEGPGAATSTPEPLNKNDFKDDPLIRKALEVFKGQIVDVRNP